MTGMESAFAASSLCVPLQGGLSLLSRSVSSRPATIARQPRNARRCIGPVAVAAAEDGVGLSSETSSKRVDIIDVMSTPGGWIVDCEVTKFDKVTKHTVVVGRAFLQELCDEAGVQIPPPEVAVDWTFHYFMSIGKDISNTEGLMEPATFPMNYFSLRQLFYFFETAPESLVAHIKKYHESA